LRVLEEYHDEFPLLLQQVPHISHGDLGFNSVAAMIIVVGVISEFGLIIVVIVIIIFTLASIDLGRW
jgi:hypothetical protein